MSDFEFEKDAMPRTRIKVVGVGGAGCNAISSMVRMGIPGVDFYAVNTDVQALQDCKCANKIQIGSELMRGMGAGGDPSRGEQAAREDRDLLASILEGSDMVFIASGMGAGTGTGAAPVVAELAREMDILSVAIVTKPFQFEGPRRRQRAMQGIERLREFVDALIVVMNDKLIETVGAKTPLVEAFEIINQILAQGVQSISDLICMPGLVNADFEDVRAVMGETGGAVLGVGIGKGEHRATEAVKKACSATLQEKIVIDGARRVLISLVGGPDMSLHEVNAASSLVYEAADPDANIIFSAVIDERLDDEVRVTIIATGFGEETSKLSSMPLGAHEKTPTDGPKEKIVEKPREKSERIARTGPAPKPPVSKPATLKAESLAAEFTPSDEDEDRFDADIIEQKKEAAPRRRTREPREALGLHDLAFRRELRMRAGGFESDDDESNEGPGIPTFEPPKGKSALPSWEEDDDYLDELESEESEEPDGAMFDVAGNFDDERDEYEYEDIKEPEVGEGKPREDHKTNLEIPAIIRRRKSFFS